MEAVSTREGTVTAADTELAYLWLGSGTPLVVVPGGPRFGFAHLRVGFDRLLDGGSIVYYDERGSGASQLGDPGVVSTAGTLSDMDALLAGLGIARAIFAGHSLGAHLAALYAATRPERVIALVLANPGPPLVPELRAPFGNEMASRRAPEDAEEMQRIEESAEYGARDPATLERHYRLRYAPFFRDRGNALNADFAFTRITAENVVEAGARLFSDFGDHRLADKLSSISCPTLVVHGELDPIPVESSRHIADAIPDAELVVIAGENHFAFIESPDAFAAAITPFLEQHRAADGPRRADAQ